ncbi:MAG: hypothetical protein WKG03_15470, partial [Telluria sp.]
MTKFQCIICALFAAFVPVLHAAPRALPAISPTTSALAAEKNPLADLVRETADGNRFILPAGWSSAAKGPSLVLTPPEGGAHIALIEVTATDADAAVAMAWASYDPQAKWPLKSASERPPRDGWVQNHFYEYEPSFDSKRNVFARALRRGERWTVMIHDVDHATGEKRVAQFERVLGSLVAKGFTRETFAGKTAHKLDADRIQTLTEFVENARQVFNV